MIVRLAVDAMRTRFEFVLIGPDEARLTAAGEEAISEIQACEDRLSLFRAGSLLSIVNREAAVRAVGVDADTHQLLRDARRLWELTEGAFDPTIAPLMKLWRLHDEQSSAAVADSLEAALGCVGMHLVELSDVARTVRFARPGVSLDLGGIAKGHALSLAAGVLTRVGIGAVSRHGDDGAESALLHAGTSSIMTIGAPPGEAGWRVRVGGPIPVADEQGHDGACRTSGKPDPVVCLRDASMSVSAPSGRGWNRGAEAHHHILDPRTGRSAHGARLAAAIGTSPTEAEAISTAMIVLNRRPRALGSETTTLLAAAGTDLQPWKVEGAGASSIVYLSTHTSKHEEPA